MAAEGATTALTRQPSLEERRLQFRAHHAFIRHEQEKLGQALEVVRDEQADLDRRIAKLQRQKDDLATKRRFIEYERDHDLEQCVITNTTISGC